VRTRVAYGVTIPVTVWVVSLHKLCGLLCEAGFRGVFFVLSVEPFVSFGG
jgi:hypothetical protein